PVPIPDPIGPVEERTFAAAPLRTAPVADEVAASFRSAATTQIRDAIKENFALLHPYFCHWPWIWPYLYRADEVAVLYTDDFGNFDGSVFFRFGDQPDLYFWVECLIDGVWTTVYRPSIPCHTYWDYACGTEVAITVTDPRVPWACQNAIAGQAIWVKTIGQSV